MQEKIVEKIVLDYDTAFDYIMLMHKGITLMVYKQS